jgi:hypothetical protein
MKVQDYSQMIGHITRDKTTDVPGSMAHGLRTGFYDGGRIGFKTAGLVKLLLKQADSGGVKAGPGRKLNEEEIEKKQNFMDAFLEYANKEHDGVFSRAAAAIGESREKIKGIFDRVRFTKTGTRKGADVGGPKMRTTIPTPEDVIPYKEATTLVKGDQTFLKNKIKNFDKNKFYSPKDIANILGVDASEKKLLDTIVTDLRRFKVDSKARTGQETGQKLYKLKDAVDKITEGYKKKLVKGQRLSTTERVAVESRLDPELRKFYNNFKTQVRRISKEEDLFVKKAVEDIGHAISIKITDKYPILFKNSNINKINTLTFQDPVLNTDVLLKSGYETSFDDLFDRLNKLVNKKIGNAELKELQSIKNEMNSLHLKVINDTKTLAKENKYFIGQERRIPKIDINIPKLGQTFKSKDLFADMSNVNPAFKVGLVEDINPNAQFFKDLTEAQKEIYKRNILDQTKFNLGKFYSRTGGVSKEQIDELKDSLEIGTAGKYGIGTAGTLITTQAAADAPVVEKGLSTGEKIAAGTTAGTLASVGSKFTKKDPLKQLRRIPKKILGKLFTGASAPFSAGAFSLSNILDLDKDSPLGFKIQDDPNIKTAGAELLLPELSKKALSKLGGPKGLQTLLSLGKYGRALTPVGIATMGVGVGKDYYDFAKDEIARVKAMPEDERRAYNEALMDEGSMFEYE